MTHLLTQCCYIKKVNRWLTVNVVILTSSKFDDFLVRDNWRVLILTKEIPVLIRYIYEVKFGEWKF